VESWRFRRKLERKKGKISDNKENKKEKRQKMKGKLKI
jgi:hypothetical protein